LRQFPELGAVVEERHDPEIREILCGSYRIIYRFHRPTVSVLAVYHGARMLGEDEFPE
jgi:plasmid stabilization system protein ParE